MRTARTRRRPDRGQVTVLVLPVLLALLGVAGLVVDGGLAIAARQRAADLAEQAARTGADQIDPDSLRGAGPVRVDAVAARAAAGRYLPGQDATGTVEVDGDTVTVAVTVTRRATLLGLVGVRHLTVTAHASARSLGGITAEDDP